MVWLKLKIYGQNSELKPQWKYFINVMQPKFLHNMNF